MSRLRLALASLVLASSLGACAASHAAPAHPAPAAPIELASADAQIDRAKLRAKLAERRATTIQRFLAYREARVYPLAEVGVGFQHVWRDVSGNLCAAATLISHDWGRAAAERVGAEDNQLALAGVKSGPLLDWILTSGLTQHEIVAIQVPGFNELMRPREDEIRRLYAIYVDVERQLNGLAQQSLDQAVDALMKRPALARALLGGVAAGPGPYAPPVG